MAWFLLHISTNWCWSYNFLQEEEDECRAVILLHGTAFYAEFLLELPNFLLNSDSKNTLRMCILNDRETSESCEYVLQNTGFEMLLFDDINRYQKLYLKPDITVYGSGNIYHNVCVITTSLVNKAVNDLLRVGNENSNIERRTNRAAVNAAGFFYFYLAIWHLS